MRRSGIGSGGGIGSRPVTHRSAPKTEPRAREMRPGGVGQLGNSQGSHVTAERESPYRGENLIGKRGYEPPGMISDPVKAVGVGGGRTIHHCGSQGVQGNVNPGQPRPNPRHDALENE
jgi:hypothetical protein